MYSGDTNSLLPHLCNLSRLTYLRLYPYDYTTEITVHKYLLRVLNTNKHTLRGLELSDLDTVRLTRWDEFFSSISTCTNLVLIRLSDTTLQHDYVTLLGTAVSRLRSLVYLELFIVPLDEIVLLHMCRGLIHHPTIQYLGLKWCKLNSNCCDPLTHLIPTLLQLKKLYLEQNNIYEPNPEPFLLLEQTAKLYSVTLEVTTQEDCEKYHIFDVSILFTFLFPCLLSY